MEKVLRTVGETALRVSRRRLVEPFPKVRTCCVSSESLGRWGRAAGWAIKGSEAVMVRGSRGRYVVGSIECDSVDSIMRADGRVEGVVTAVEGAGADKRGGEPSARTRGGGSCRGSYSG